MTTPQVDPCPTCGYPRPEKACGHCDDKIVSVDGVTTIQPGRRFVVNEIFEGFFSLFQASLQLMTKKEYIGKLTLAIALNVLLVSVLGLGTFWAFWELFETIGESLSEYKPSWEWLAWVVDGVSTWVIVIAAIFSGLLAMWFLSPALISAGMTPFLDPIANATEMMLAGDKMKPVEMGLWRGLMAGMNAAAQVLVLQICVLIPVIVLSWIPVVGWLFVIFGILYSAYLNALVWFEIPIMRRGYGWRYRREVIRRNWPRALGFGLAFNLGLLVPFFNILFIGPATAVAVSLLYFRFDKGKLPVSASAAPQPSGKPV